MMKTDSFWKEVLEKLFKQFLQFFFPEVYEAIDFAKGYQFLDKEFRQITRSSETGKKIVDKLVKVYLKNGHEKWLLIHIEIQGQKQKDFARRMFTYYYRIFDKYQKDVLSLALLTDRDKAYRPEKYLQNYLGLSLVFKFPLVKIVDYIHYNFEPEYRKNIFSIIAQSYLKTMETEGDYRNRFQWKRKFILQLYELGLDRETLFDLYQFIEWIMALPKDLEDQIFQEIKQIEEQKQMPYITYAERKGLQEGLKEGLKAGRKQGHRKGKLEGKIEGLRKAIESVLEVKFNTIDKELTKQLTEVRSLKKLEKLLHQAKLIKTIEEFKKNLEETING